MDNIAIVKDFIAAWEAQDINRVMSFFTEDAVYHNIPMPVVNGLADIRNTIQSFINIGDKLVFETHHIAETSSGTVMTERTDKFHINDQWLSLPVMGVFEMKGGKITKWRDYFDLGQFQSQLALIGNSKVAQ